MKFYDPSSYCALKAWLGDAGSQIISDRQVAFITEAPSFAARFHRQRVIEAGSGTVQVENALYGDGIAQILLDWLDPFSLRHHDQVF